MGHVKLQYIAAKPSACVYEADAGDHPVPSHTLLLYPMCLPICAPPQKPATTLSTYLDPTAMRLRLATTQFQTGTRTATFCPVTGHLRFAFLVALQITCPCTRGWGLGGGT